MKHVYILYHINRINLAMFANRCSIECASFVHTCDHVASYVATQLKLF